MEGGLLEEIEGEEWNCSFASNELIYWPYKGEREAS
jgi:hypothetical protein